MTNLVEKTCEAWLTNMDRHRNEIMPLFDKTYGGPVEAVKWWNRWRVFYLSCAELFGYNHGQEWVVAHYLFKRR